MEGRIFWGVKDSNLRRLSQQIYSLPPLTARETPPVTIDLFGNITNEVGHVSE